MPKRAGWIERFLLAIGLAAIGYCAAMFLYARWSQDLAERSLELELQTVRHRTPVLPTQEGSVMGRIEIPSIDFSAMIFEGSDDWVLRRGVGHVPKTAQPGRPGNVALTGHRDTFFRPLERISSQDEIILTTPTGRYRYRVERTRVVSPNDVSVLEPSSGAKLTLITCYPFHFVGPAPKRFIVQAHLVNANAVPSP